MAGLFATSKGRLVSSAEEGRWGEALEILEGLDVERHRQSFLEDYRLHHDGKSSLDGDDDGCGEKDYSTMVTPLEKAVALAHEMTILELADHGEVELAYAALRMCSEMLDSTLPASNENDREMDDNGGESDYKAGDIGNSGNLGIISSRSGDVERRITSLSSLRTSSASNGASTALLLPVNYYGPSNQTQQKRRSQIAKLLKRLVPEVPMQRLASLLQQSVRWQCHTGVFPTIQRLFQHNDDEDGKIVDKDGKSKKKKRKQTTEQRFDLVLGNVDIIGSQDGKKKRKSSANDNSVVERIPSRSTQTIRLGKNSYIESAIFLPDGRGLVTGSSDGFIEIWGEPISEKGGVDDDVANKVTGMNAMIQTNINYENLRTSDLSYQRNDDLMMHDTAVLAMDVSNDGTLLGTTSSDGTVCVWKIMDGKLLRKLERAHGGSGGGDKGAAVTCIQFSPDGSKILTGGHDSTAREFGLLASRMLKEFRGHRSYVNCCSYVTLSNKSATTGESKAASGNALVVVTASADGNVRVWDGKTAEPMREITPPIPTSNAVVLHGEESIVSSKSIHTVMHLHSPPQTMIVVPRTDRAYLMSYTGAVLRVFTRDDVQGTDFLAASVSPSNRWLFVAADDGKCVAFDVNTGKVEKVIASFGEECSGRSEKASDITGIIHHPFRGLIGGYSNSKGQKRGILTLWK